MAIENKPTSGELAPETMLKDQGNSRKEARDRLRWKNLFLALLVLLVFMLLLSFYFFIHKPIGLSQARHLGISIWRLLVAGAIFSLGGAIGSTLLAGRDFGKLTTPTVQAGLGLGILSIAIFLLGSTIGLNPYVLAGAVIVAMLALHRGLLGWWTSWFEIRNLWTCWGRFEKVLALGALTMGFLTLGTSLSPPLKFDALVYHLAIPQAYLGAGGIQYLPENMYWGMPQATESLFTLAMSLAGPAGAVVLGWGIGLLAILGLLGYVQSHFGGRAAWVGVASLLAGFSLAASLSWGYVEWAAMLLGVVFLIVMDGWLGRKDLGLLLLAGVVAGMAFGVKYTAGVLFLTGIGVIFWVKYFKGGTPWRSLIYYSLAAGLLAFPWLLKNFLATGNPVYPLLLPAGAMDPIRLAQFQTNPPWGNLFDVLILPVRATLLGVEGSPGYAASIGPLLLGLSLFAWLGWRARPASQQRGISLAALVVLQGLLIWILAARFSGLLIQTRFYLVIFPAVAFLAAAGYSGLAAIELPSIRLDRVIGALVGVVFGLNLLALGVEVVDAGTWRYLTGRNSDEAYLAENLGWYSHVMKLVTETAGESQVLMLWEPRGFYCYPTCVPDESLDRWIRDIRTRGGPERVLQSWRSLGYTHLLIYEMGQGYTQNSDGRYSPADWEALADLLGSLPTPSDLGGSYLLYSLAP